MCVLMVLDVSRPGAVRNMVVSTSLDKGILVTGALPVRVVSREVDRQSALGLKLQKKGIATRLPVSFVDKEILLPLHHFLPPQD